MIKTVDRVGDTEEMVFSGGKMYKSNYKAIIAGEIK
jgi:hypothetical protein